MLTDARMPPPPPPVCCALHNTGAISAAHHALLSRKSISLIPNGVNMPYERKQLKKKKRVSNRKLRRDSFSWNRSDYVNLPVPPAPWYTAFMVYFSCLTICFLSWMADCLRFYGLINGKSQQELPTQRHFPCLHTGFNALYANNIYRLASDVLNRPIAGVPGAHVEILERVTKDYGFTYEFTGKKIKAINLGSYNYLGFSQITGSCADAAAKAIDDHGIAVPFVNRTQVDFAPQRQLEKEIAQYLGVEDTIIFSQGFGTNGMNISALVGPNSLILSDEFNHSSIALGCQLAGATVKVFRHNDPEDCERQIVHALMHPTPKDKSGTYDKILIVIEGIYSMEGSIVDLPGFIRVKKRCKAWLYVDEAHSFGALGRTGKGITEYWDVDPREVDVLMGTLTKSFAGSGGYIGGSQKLVDYLRARSIGSNYGGFLPPAIIGQVRKALQITQSAEGRRRGAQLLRNTRYFRRMLQAKGFRITGHLDSPVIPVMTYYLSKVVLFGRVALEGNVASVSVGYPATAVNATRARFCVSAEHTKEELDKVLDWIDVIGDLSWSKYGKVDPHPEWIQY